MARPTMPAGRSASDMDVTASQTSGTSTSAEAEWGTSVTMAAPSRKTECRSRNSPSFSEVRPSWLTTEP